MPFSRSPRGIVKPRFDPLVQPVISTKALPALAAESIRIEFIRKAFGQSFPWRVEPVFAHSFDEEKRACGMAGAEVVIIEAAVLIALIQRPSGLHVLFTRRAAHLYDHAGQISFPGGRIEPDDAGAVAAAVRETWEEVGIAPEFIDVLGTQPSFLTSTGFTMKPVIAHVRPGFAINPDLAEVAEVFEVPLAVLMDTSRHCLHEARLPEGRNRFYFSMSWHSHFIWGATAALIRNLYHYLAAAQLSSN